MALTDVYTTMSRDSQDDSSLFLTAADSVQEGAPLTPDRGPLVQMESCTAGIWDQLFVGIRMGPSALLLAVCPISYAVIIEHANEIWDQFDGSQSAMPELTAAEAGYDLSNCNGMGSFIWAEQFFWTVGCKLLTYTLLILQLVGQGQGEQTMCCPCARDDPCLLAR